MKEEKPSLLKVLFGGRQENILILVFVTSLIIFITTGAEGVYGKEGFTIGIKILLAISGITMIAVLVILPFLLFRFMIKNKKE